MSCELHSGSVVDQLMVRVPGKAMLIGEYAVLDGSDAVVAAVDSYALASLRPGAAATSPFVQAALREAASALLRLGRSLSKSDHVQVEVDTSAFSHEGQKLGLGSSAAVTVSTVGCYFAWAGLAVETSEVRTLIAETAQRAHDSAQGIAGSGADILASTWGGLRRLGAGLALAGKEPPPLRLPAGLVLHLVGTTQSASTAQLVARYRAAQSAVVPARQQLANAAAMFVAGCEAGNAAQVLAAVRQAAKGYRQLGTVLGCPLLTDEHAEVTATAARLGGAAKPSGAGGGDLAVALLPDVEAAQRFAAALPRPLWVLPLQISDRGIHAMPAQHADTRGQPQLGEGSRLPLSTIEHPNDSSRGA